ncbi:hypothetical protein B0T11DRAFT_124934 [Plectosphaerella cucumerina]|uniref:BZIP domain-containing protein n=1 Tax=Plectosphaerella cucumerina TaxID=40658 RepID=A0A8K0T6N9_9PEZI|nr:hypothetical protein B0T11DRAFT_124934 [Plectosphaerella cucumerina]
MSWSGRTAEQPREPVQSPSPRTVPAANEQQHAPEVGVRGQHGGAHLEDSSRPASSRSLGIHGLINPANAPPADRRLPELQTSPYGGPVSHLSTPTGTPRPYMFSGHGPPQPVTTPLARTPSERGSPATSYPFPAINNPRQIASPLSGPPAELNRGPPERFGGSGLPEHSPTLAPDPSLPRYPERGPEASPAGHNVHGIHALPFPGHRAPDRPPGALSQGVRSMSQPIIPYPRFGSHMQPSGAPRPQNWPVQQGHPPPGQHNAPSPTTAQSPSQSAEEPVGTPLYRTLLSVAANGGFDGGKPTLTMASGPGGELLTIELDTNNASRQMDEKRQRNATASHRHRYRKKEERQMLESEHRELKAQLAAMQHERDFYRAERARLKDILLRTPYADQAAGPPSPPAGAPLSLPEGSSSDPGSLRAGVSRPASAAPMTERPTRRRRTKGPGPDSTLPNYAPVSPGPAPLPSISGQGYGSSSEPSPPLPASSRLPSLRAVEGVARDNVPTQTAGGPPYPTYPRVPHETGWVHHITEQPGLAHPSLQGNPPAPPPHPYQGPQNPHNPR